MKTSFLAFAVVLYALPCRPQKAMQKDSCDHKIITKTNLFTSRIRYYINSKEFKRTEIDDLLMKYGPSAKELEKSRHTKQLFRYWLYSSLALNGLSIIRLSAAPPSDGLGQALLISSLFGGTIAIAIGGSAQLHRQKAINKYNAALCYW